MSNRPSRWPGEPPCAARITPQPGFRGAGLEPFARSRQAGRAPTGRRPRHPPAGRGNRPRAMLPRRRQPRGRPGRSTLVPGGLETGAGPIPPLLPVQQPASERPTRAPGASRVYTAGAPSGPRTRRSSAAREPPRWRVPGARRDTPSSSRRTLRPTPGPRWRAPGRRARRSRRPPRTGRPTGAVAPRPGSEPASRKRTPLSRGLEGSRSPL